MDMKRNQINNQKNNDLNSFSSQRINLLNNFQNNLKIHFDNINLLDLAFHHRSYANENGNHLLNNERLEFLGDAILDAIISDVVFQHFKGKREGFLTNTRSKIVQRETLNKVAVEIKLDKLIISSTHSHSHNSYIYGNAFEALIGAIYLDKGYIYCKRFVERRILKRLINIDKLAYKEVNFKSKLIEWGQKKHIEICFDLIEESKEDTCTPIFITQARIGDIIGGTGRGYSKKESQQIAAQNALKLIKDSPNLFICTNQEDQIENSTD